VLLILISWIVSVALAILNFQLLQFLEGYGLLAKTFLLSNQRKKFDNLNDKVETIRSCLKYIKNDENEISPKVKEECLKLINEKGKTEIKKVKDYRNNKPYQKLMEEYVRLMYRSRSEYPLKREHLLATSFGNAIRSFELYSYEVYGIDSIAVWPRILQFVPNEQKESIVYAKAQVIFAMNLFYVLIAVIIEYIAFSFLTMFSPMILVLLSFIIISAVAAFEINLLYVLIIIIVEYFSLSLMPAPFPMVWIPLVLIIFTSLAYKLATNSSKKWGEEVKTVFDLYRYDLLEKMGFDIKNINEEETWMRLNKRFLYWQ
jgi:hypothetical protein